MALIRFKSTVRVPKVCIIEAAVINAANVLDLPDMLVTSGNDSAHMKGSKHYEDAALDFRTHHLTDEQKQGLKAVVKARLGSAYDVILESLGTPNEHLHVEHDPS